MKSKAIALLCAALSGCATYDIFRQRLDAYVGQHERVIVTDLGPPNSMHQLPDGARVLNYTRGGTFFLPGATTYRPTTAVTSGTYQYGAPGTMPSTGTYTGLATVNVPQQAPALPISFSCSVNVLVDPAGIIRRWNATGNNCMAEATGPLFRR